MNTQGYHHQHRPCQGRGKRKPASVLLRQRMKPCQSGCTRACDQGVPAAGVCAFPPAPGSCALIGRCIEDLQDLHSSANLTLPEKRDLCTKRAISTAVSLAASAYSGSKKDIFWPLMHMAQTAKIHKESPHKATDQDRHTCSWLAWETTASREPSSVSCISSSAAASERGCGRGWKLLCLVCTPAVPALMTFAAVVKAGETSSIFSGRAGFDIRDKDLLMESIDLFSGADALK